MAVAYRWPPWLTAGALSPQVLFDFSQNVMLPPFCASNAGMRTPGGGGMGPLRTPPRTHWILSR
jgi:hypothetical protein